jgi:hypothetical protein
MVIPVGWRGGNGFGVRSITARIAFCLSDGKNKIGTIWPVARMERSATRESAHNTNNKRLP